MNHHKFESATIPVDVLRDIVDALQSIEFGSVEIQIHNGQVVQLERREKKRWDKRNKPSVELVSE